MGHATTTSTREPTAGVHSAAANAHYEGFSYLNDMLAWNLNAMKKCHFAAAHCQDTEIKAELDKCGQMHQRHYQQLLTHLNTTNQNMM